MSLITSKENKQSFIHPRQSKNCQELEIAMNGAWYLLFGSMVKALLMSASAFSNSDVFKYAWHLL